MATKSRMEAEPAEADTIRAAPVIVVQRLETVAEIFADEDFRSGDTVIEAAWKAAGNYLAVKVGEGKDTAVQFVYDGVTHHASVEVPS